MSNPQVKDLKAGDRIRLLVSCEVEVVSVTENSDRGPYEGNCTLAYRVISRPDTGSVTIGSLVNVERAADSTQGSN